MLIFYYGLLFLATLCISDGVATFLVLCIVDFLIGKAIWQDYEPFVTWRKKKYEQLIKLKKSLKKPLLKKWEKASLLKKAYVIVAGVVGFALLILFIRLYLEVLWISWDDIGADDKIRNLAIAFVGTITGIGALFGVYLAILRSEENKRQNDVAEKQSQTAIEQSKIANTQSKIANEQSKAANEQSRAAHRQAKTAEQGLITDRINKAVEGLGKINGKDEPLREVRLGALYALERIAQDSIRDHIRIMQIICGYVRVNRIFHNKATKTTIISHDIRVALYIISGRDSWTKNKDHLKKEIKERYRLDLRHSDLHNAVFWDADLSNAMFANTTLREAILIGVNLKDANLFETDLSDAYLKNANMENVYTNNSYAHTGDFSDCLTFTQEQINEMFLGVDVKLAKGLTHPQKGTEYYQTYHEFKDFIAAYREWRKTR